jgi:hypothetical protein
MSLAGFYPPTYAIVIVAIHFSSAWFRLMPQRFRTVCGLCSSWSYIGLVSTFTLAVKRAPKVNANAAKL